MNWMSRGVELWGEERSTDENLTRPFFLLQLNFWSTPLPGIRDFDDLFCFNSVFGAPLCLGSEISTTFFCSNSVFGAPLCPGPDISTTFFVSTQFLEHPFVL